MSIGTEPALEGLTYVRRLGRGGFADVYLYRQEWPNREVAVKVLRHDVDEEFKARFKDEANLMAQVSAHPAIVTIYAASVSEDGRPYLVMEHCPYPHLGQRAKQEPFQVQEALRTGIQIAGAVESAHRLDIIHRDIKPANILVTAFRHPALTDFGISVTRDRVQSYGVSVPWAPPEQIEGADVTVRSDVYALGATLYTLVAGHSPFGGGGLDQDLGALAERVCTQPVPPIGRSDVPQTFEDVLRTAMAKNPLDRYPTAIEFGRAMQRVQHGLDLTVTPIEAMDGRVEPEQVRREDHGHTVIVAPRKAENAPDRWAREGNLGTDPLAISAPTGPGSNEAGRGDSTGQSDSRTWQRNDEDADRTRLRTGQSAPQTSGRRRLPVWALIAMIGAVLAGAGGAVGWAVGGRGSGPALTPIAEYTPPFGIVERRSLKKGDCLVDREPESSVPSELETGPCAEPHYGEVIWSDRLPQERQFEGVRAETGSTCDHTFTGYQSVTGFVAEDYHVRGMPPSPESWAAGDRAVTCVIYRDDGRPVQGSVYAGSGVSAVPTGAEPTGATP